MLAAQCSLVHIRAQSCLIFASGLYFDLPKMQAQQGLQIYTKFVGESQRMDTVIAIGQVSHRLGFL